MTVVQVLRFQEICNNALQLLLLLLLLPLPLLRSSPCPTTVEERIVSTTSDAARLAEALLCDGPANFTVIWNGDIMSSRTLNVSNGSTLSVTGSSENSDNAVITGDGTVLLLQVDLDSTVSLTGLTLSGGDGAVRVIGGSFVEVVNCTFTQNKRTSSDQGGAVYVSGSNVVLKNETLFANNTAIYGGAIYADDHSNISFGGYADFANNTATDGGAIYAIDSSELDVTEGGTVYFSHNQAVDSGGAMVLLSQGVFNSYGTSLFVCNEAKFGGAIAVVDGSIVLVDGMTSFEGNEATVNGGAIHASGSLVFCETGARFWWNTASMGSGGGVYAVRSVIAFTGAEFKENHGAKGGGVASSYAISDEETGGIDSSRITGCRFDGNTATEGGAIYSAEGFDEVKNSSFTSNHAVVEGGALLHFGTLEALTDCTFESNMAGEDGVAVTIFGLVDNITNLTFRDNSFYCASGKYGLVENNDEVEDLDTCRWHVVCSGCTKSLCPAPVRIDMDESTVPVCEVVPEGVSTTGNGGMTLETLNLMPGFYRTSNKSRDVLECYQEKSCSGGSNSSRYCAEGYTGVWYKPGFQYSCHSCQGSDKWAAIGGAVTMLVVVVSVVVFGVAYLVGVEDRPISQRSGMWKRRISNFRDGLIRIIPLTAVKIVLVSWQIITQFSSMVNVQYPPAYENFLAALDVVNLNLVSILSLSCVMETNFYYRLILVTIAPVAVFGVLVLTYRVAMLRNGHSVHAKRMVKNKHLSVGLFILFIVYSSVSYTIFQTFACDSLEFGVTYLRADYGLECWTKTHVAFMTYAGLMMLVYPVGIPAVFAWALYINRDGIKSVAGSTDRSQVSPEPEAIKDLWAPYKRSRYYYEVIECGRRIALTGLAVFIYPGSTAQVAMEALLAVAFFSISEILSPFAEPLDAWLYRSGTWTVFLNMYLALLLKMDNVDDGNRSQDVFAGLLIAAHVGMVLIVITNALLSALKGFREVRDVESP